MAYDWIAQPNPALLCLIVAFAAPLVTVVSGVRRASWTGPVAVASAALAFGVVLWAIFQDDVRIDTVWADTFALRFHLELDGLARLYALLATGIGLLVVIYASSYLPRHLEHHDRSLDEMPRFFGFLLLFMAAMVGLVMAQDAILLFLFWDLTAIASFFLIGFDREEEGSRSSALMALIVTGVSAVLVLIGALLLFEEFGTFAIQDMIAQGSSAGTVGTAMALISVGALAKSAQVPLHFWLPRAMAAPTPVSAYLHSAAMVAAGVFLVGRFYPMIARFDWLLDAFLVIGFASMAVGGVIALTRDVLKQILAYSTISQYGYVVVMFGLGGEYGVAGASFVIAHALVKSALFLTAGAVTEATGSTVLSGTGGLWRSMPLLAMGSGLAAAGLVALPLTAGFFKDELFFAAAYERGPVYATLAVFGAALTFAYIARLWSGMFLGPIRSGASPIPPSLVAPVVVLGVLTVIWGIWTTPLARLAEGAASVSTAVPAAVPAARDIHIDVAYHLDLRHENVMALATWGLGILLLASRSLWRPAAMAFAQFGARFGPERIYDHSLAGLELVSDAIHRYEVRDLRSRIATILAPAGALVGLAVIVTPNSDAFAIGAIGREDLPLITMLVAAGFASVAVAIPRDHLQIVITMSCVGFSLAVIYALLGAPDVALVAVLVETILGVFFIGMLLLMPRSILRYETRLRAEGRNVWRDGFLAVIASIMAFFVVWGTLSRPSPSTTVIDRQTELTSLAHGKDVVTVILADFRGFDTFGEICVITLVLLGVMSLIRRGRLR